MARYYYDSDSPEPLPAAIAAACAAATDQPAAYFRTQVDSILDVDVTDALLAAEPDGDPVRIEFGLFQCSVTLTARDGDTVQVEAHAT